MTDHSTTVTKLRLAPSVCFEPCLSFDDDPSDLGVCSGCGWPTDDHEPDVEAIAA